MAQPVFDEREHPLGEYLRDVGETHYILPGVTPDMERDLEAHYRAKYDLNDDDDDDRGEEEEEGPEWRLPRRVLVRLSDVWRFVLESLLSTTTTTTTTPATTRRTRTRTRTAAVANPCVVERFKYTVISSSLLSSSLPVHHHSTRTPSSSSSSSFVIPSKPHGVEDGGEPPSNAGLLRTNAAVAAAEGETRRPREPAHSTTPTASILVVCSISALLLSLGWSFSLLAVVLTIAPVYYVSHWRRRRVADEKESGVVVVDVRPDIELTIDALGELISANRSWESAVQETISFLEDEERTPYSSHRLPSSPSPMSPNPFPSSASPCSSSMPIRIRVALHTCLQTTQSQCDNIRRLFSALTCPTELSQLAEMYAPPSPLRVTFGGGDRDAGSGSGRRPWSYPVGASSPSPSVSFSAPGRRHRPLTPSPFMSPTKTFNDEDDEDEDDDININKVNKRSTWSGVQQQHGLYASLADAGSPTSTTYRNGLRTRRRTEAASLEDVFGYDTVTKVAEEEEEEAEAVTGQFASAALDLQRRRRSGGIEAFLLKGSSSSPPPSLLLSRTPQTMKKKRPSLLSPLPTATAAAATSRYTRPQPARHHRHPLSFASLTCALQDALGAKRYACAHLLALRFYGEDSHPPGGVEQQQQQQQQQGDGDGDGDYWENVRSVILLLTSALVDSAGRLGEALEDAEGVKLREGEVTPPEGERTRSSRTSGGGHGLFELAATTRAATASNNNNNGSFAPMPSGISRFAAHVAAISSALDDAKEHLEKCVEALTSRHDDGKPLSPTTATATRTRRKVHAHTRHAWGGRAEEDDDDDGDEEEKTAAKAMALEAYERLRRELGIALRECERGRERLIEVVAVSHPALPASDDEEEAAGVEGLPALGHDASDESDKLDPVSPRSEVGDAGGNTPNGGVVKMAVDDEDDNEDDDVTAHLLWTSSAQHLPMPGIEEVFEAEQEQAHFVPTPAAAAAAAADTSDGGVAVGPFLRERSKLTREERVRMAKRARMMTEEDGERGVVVVGLEKKKPKVERERWGPGGDVVQELKDVIWKVGERKRKLGGQPTTTTTTTTTTVERILDSSSTSV